MSGQDATYGDLEDFHGLDADYQDIAAEESRSISLQTAVAARDTAILISGEGRPVALTTPGTYARTAEGGRRRTGPPVVGDTVQRFFQTVRAESAYAESDMGNMQREEAVLIGMPDDPMQEGDTFPLDGGNWEIYEVNRDRRYETRARCREIS